MGESSISISLKWTPELYKGLEDMAKVYLSTRWMLLATIAERSLTPDVSKVLFNNLTSLHQKEILIHESNPQKYGNTFGKQLSFENLHNILSQEKSNTNKHHIVPTDKGSGFSVFNGKIAYSKSMKNRLPDFGAVFSEYTMLTRNKHGKLFTGKMKGSDDPKNIYPMNIQRHNHGLNQRYGGNAFVQMQLLLERYGENKSYRDVLFYDCKELDEIDRIIHLPLSEFHHPDCLDPKENSKR